MLECLEYYIFIYFADTFQYRHGGGGGGGGGVRSALGSPAPTQSVPTRFSACLGFTLSAAAGMVCGLASSLRGTRHFQTKWVLWQF